MVVMVMVMIMVMGDGDGGDITFTEEYVAGTA